MHREELSTSVLMIPDGKYLKKAAVLLFAENPENGYRVRTLR